jgi:hypothetical protein
MKENYRVTTKNDNKNGNIENGLTFSGNIVKFFRSSLFRIESADIKWVSAPTSPYLSIRCVLGSRLNREKGPGMNPMGTCSDTHQNQSRWKHV